MQNHIESKGGVDISPPTPLPSFIYYSKSRLPIETQSPLCKDHALAGDDVGLNLDSTYQPPQQKQKQKQQRGDVRSMFQFRELTRPILKLSS